jgi:hypothetical protein
VRAIPGEYRVRLQVGEEVVEQPLTVRADPRVKSTPEDMQAWRTAAKTIERVECSLDRAAADLAAIDRQVADLERRASDQATKARVEAVRRELRPIVLALRGDPRDPGHVNLPGRINWLTIQVGNNSGRPTAAQTEWITRYAEQADAVVRALDAVKVHIADR